jgi:polysaccharide biosynthesis protein PslG
VPPEAPILHRCLSLARRLLFACLLLLLVAPPGLAARGAYRADSPEYGLNAFPYDQPATTERDFGLVQGLGFGWVKVLFPWAGIEKEAKGAYNWAEADRVVRAAAAANLKIIARLDRQPRWARADLAHTGPPDNYQDYADFVGAFVSRYKAGSPIGTVQAIQVWNEPNLDREWGGRRPIDGKSAADYVRLLTLAHRAAKAADPGVTVIAGSLAPTGWDGPEALPDDRYLQAMFESGLKGNYDVLGANANVQCPSVEARLGACPVMPERLWHPSFYFRRVEQLREIMVAHGDGDKQIWLMEFGWTTDKVHESYAWYATDEATKAELIVRAFEYARKEWSPWIGVMALWTVADPAWSPDDEQVWWSITNPDGTRRPAYDRLARAVEAGQLPGAGRPRAAPATEARAATPAEEAPPAAPAPATPPADSPPPAEAAPPPPTEERLRVVRTDGSGVNLRAAPGLGAARIATVPEGAVLLAVDGPREAEGRTWRRVRDPAGKEGWVAAEFLAPA